MGAFGARHRRRTSQPVLAACDLPEGHDAQAVYECLIELTADLPDALRRSLTWDQRRETAMWTQLRVDADIEVYFCDPHSPWQRPSNEHMNGALRQYFPKGTDLDDGAPRPRSTLTSLHLPLDRAR